MRICIYCLARKPDSTFNREHVIPEAFGKFEERNFVLTCVCQDCNTYFANTIDLKIARDAIEGIDRYWSGMKATQTFKGLGVRSTTTVEFKEGHLRGARGFLEPNPSGQELCVVPFAQIGFSHAKVNGGEPLWFRVDDLPNRARLVALGFEVPVNVHVGGMNAEEARSRLESIGFRVEHDFEEVEVHDGLVYMETVGIVGRPEMRVAAKIALNYLASVTDPAFVRSPQFNGAREFVRFDRGASITHVSHNPWRILRDTAPASGHYLAAELRPSGLIVAQVSLMLRLRYIVHLTMSKFSTTKPRVSSAHFFNTASKQIGTMPVPDLVQSEPLRAVSR